MTETFGPCGIGWAYEIVRTWLEPAIDGQVMAFTEIRMRVKVDGEWSLPVPGIGGSTFIAKESAGLHASDECFKMATTDALSVAMKAMGVAADIYAGLWDGSKYRTADTPKDDSKKLSSADWEKKFDMNCEKNLPAVKEWRLKNGKDIVATIANDEEKLKLKKFLDDNEKIYAEIKCPETDTTVTAATCQGKPCSVGCPELKG